MRNTPINTRLATAMACASSLALRSALAAGAHAAPISGPACNCGGAGA